MDVILLLGEVLNMNSFTRGQLVALAAVSLSLIGCGGDSGSDAISGPLEGRVIDGYIRGAIVCLDRNNNLVCDDAADEERATTGEGGVFEIVPTRAVPLGVQIIAEVGTDAVDEDLGPVNEAFSMLTPVDKADVVSPLSTLVAREMRNSGGSSSEEAEAAVKASFGFDDSKSLFDDFIAGDDTDSQATASVVAAALARTKTVLNTQKDLGNHDLTDDEMVSAALDSAIDDVVKKVIVGGKPTFDVSSATSQDEFMAAVDTAANLETTIQGKLANIVLNTRLGAPEVVNLGKLVRDGELVIVESDDYSTIDLDKDPQTTDDRVRARGLYVEWIYHPESTNGGTFTPQDNFDFDWFPAALYVDEASDIVEGDASGFEKGWYPVVSDNTNYLLIDGQWELESEVELGIRVNDNCAETLFGTSGSGKVGDTACFTSRDVSGQAIGDLVFDVCDNAPNNACDKTAKVPSGSLFYNLTLGAENLSDGGVWEVFVGNDWSGYESAATEDGVSLETFISKASKTSGSPRVHYIGSGCHTAFMFHDVKYEDEKAVSGSVLTLNSGVNDCSNASKSVTDFFAGDELNETVESASFTVETVGEERVLKFVPTNGYRDRDGVFAEPYITFAKVYNPTMKTWGIFNGEYLPVNYKRNTPFTGNLDDGLFGSKVVLDFGLELRGEPALPEELLKSIWYPDL